MPWRLQDGSLKELLEAVVKACQKADPSSPNHSATALACAYSLLIYCHAEADQLSKAGSVATQGLAMADVCSCLCHLLSLRAYAEATVTKEQAQCVALALQNSRTGSYIPKARFFAMRGQDRASTWQQAAQRAAGLCT